MTAPLEDPRYQPLHPPVKGLIPWPVIKWGPRSQLRWFDRFRDQLALRQDWGSYYCASQHHAGGCCVSCIDDEQMGYGPIGHCCCRSIDL